MKRPPPPSERELRLKSHTAAIAAPPLSPPKPHVSRKWNQSNVDESATKWTKTAAGEGAEADEGEDNNDAADRTEDNQGDDAAAHDHEEAIAIAKGGRKGAKGAAARGKGMGKGARRGKAPSKTRKTSTQRHQEDTTEAAKGPPTHLKPVARKLDGAATSVAPPECPPCSPTSSILPPPPTVSNSCAQVVQEPEITGTKAKK
ncbi:hypothetical protein CVT25_004842, partial [Psilocybe cyanescens]